jgi:hypothetical protein
LNRQAAYDYHTALLECRKGMKGPSKTGGDKGTWGCNGKYHFFALSDGGDIQRLTHQNVPDFKCGGVADVTPVAGSQSTYGFRRVRVA